VAVIVAFDLDDTLYRELDYVESGFRAVADHIADSQPITSDEAYEFLIKSMERNGRGQQFDDLLVAIGAFTIRRRDQLVQVYRQHIPRIKLPTESSSVLSAIAADGHRLFLATDGNHHVQNLKVEALGLRSYVEHAYLTGRYGHEAAKPGTKVFKLMLERTRAEAADLVYVGDNPRKDFIGIRSLGGSTIRVLTGAFAKEAAAPGYESDLTVNSISEVPGALKLLNR